MAASAWLITTPAAPPAPPHRPCERQAAPTRSPDSAERRNSRSILGDHSGVVQLSGAGGLTVDQHGRAGPHRDARAAAATFLVTHNVTPLRAIDVAVAIGKWSHGGVDVEVVTRTDDVTDLV